MANIKLSRNIKEEYLEKAKHTFAELQAIRPTAEVMQTYIDTTIFKGVGVMSSILEEGKDTDKVAAFKSLVAANKHFNERIEKNRMNKVVEEIEIDYDELMNGGNIQIEDAKINHEDVSGEII